MKRTEKLKKLGGALILTIILISTLSFLPISQSTQAQTADEMLNAVKEAYPVLQNPSFETGNFLGWKKVNEFSISTISTPDGVYCVVTTGTNSYLVSPCIIIGTRLTFYYTTFSPELSNTITIYAKFYDAAGEYIEEKEIYAISTDTTVWTLADIPLQSQCPQAHYVQLRITGCRIYLDAFYIGNNLTTRFFTLTPCDVQTVQNQNEYISFWVANSFGVAINNVKITVENFALKSLVVNCVRTAGNDMGYHAIAEQKYIQLGIESPSALGIYNVSVLFIYYDTYNLEIGRERFLIQVSNIAIQVGLDFDKIKYERGQQGTLQLKNNMDRGIRIYIHAWYEASMFLYGDQEYPLATGETKLFTLNLIEQGKYTFEFRVYYDEVLQTRELRIQKAVHVVPANIRSKFAAELYDIKGGSILDYSFFTNNTELASYRIYIRTTYPNGGTSVTAKTVYNGLYEWHLSIPIPPSGYRQTNFKIEVFRQLNTTADIQYGTGEYYQDGIKIWERTYTVYESAKPITPLGWPELENYQWILIALAIALASFGFLYLAVRRRKR